MVTVIFAVLFTCAMLFAGVNIWQAVLQSKERIAILSSHARQSDANDWASVSFRASSTFVASPPPEFAFQETIRVAHVAISVPKWQSWCSTGYVAPHSIAKKWQESPSLNGSAKWQRPCLPRSTVNICEIMPNRCSRVAEPSNFPALLPSYNRLSIGFLAAHELAGRGLPSEQRLLA